MDNRISKHNVSLSFSFCVSLSLSRYGKKPPMFYALHDMTYPIPQKDIHVVEGYALDSCYIVVLHFIVLGAVVTFCLFDITQKGQCPKQHDGLILRKCIIDNK